jgi:hypothetical protein
MSVVVYSVLAVAAVAIVAVADRILVPIVFQSAV